MKTKRYPLIIYIVLSILLFSFIALIIFISPRNVSKSSKTLSTSSSSSSSNDSSSSFDVIVVPSSSVVEVSSSTSADSSSSSPYSGDYFELSFSQTYWSVNDHPDFGKYVELITGVHISGASTSYYYLFGYRIERNGHFDSDFVDGVNLGGEMFYVDQLYTSYDGKSTSEIFGVGYDYIMVANVLLNGARTFSAQAFCIVVEPSSSFDINDYSTFNIIEAIISPYPVELTIE